MQAYCIPLFVQVAETIKARIINHEYSPGDSIPSSSELEEEFDVSNITIRRAMELLIREGYIISRRGMRAQVADHVQDIVEIEITGDFWSWIDSAVGRKQGIAARVLSRDVIDCPKPIQDKLQLKPGEKVERIKRVRKLKQKPVSYFINYYPDRLLTRISSREIESRTFIEAYQDVCKVKLKSMEQIVRATNADMDLADILQVPFGFPLFFVQNIYYSGKEIPMAVTHMYYRSDCYVYTIKRNI